MILHHIEADSKKTIKELSQNLNLSTSPVFERIKGMEKNIIIKAYTTLVDNKKLGK
jgi:Lrp/AsnC family leucine-responsive transcriptional regulator